MSEFQPPTLRQRAGAVADLAQEHAAETERLRQLHPEVVQAMQDMSLPQLLKQGSISTIREFIDVCGILAEGDMSTGWCNFVWGVHNFLAGLYPEEVQEKVWQNPKTLNFFLLIDTCKTHAKIHAKHMQNTRKAHAKHMQSQLIATWLSVGIEHMVPCFPIF